MVAYLTIRVPGTFMVLQDGKAVSKYQPTTRNSMHSGMFLTAIFNRFFFPQKVQALLAGRSCILLLVMRKRSLNAIQYYTCSMAGAKMKRPGATRDMQT